MYQYTDCFLDNIWLINGYTLNSGPEGDLATIIDLDSLHEIMMNLDVGSILKIGEPFFFYHTEAGWKLDTKKSVARSVA